MTKPALSMRFDLDDQRAFARFSGDWNPMHVDPMFSRRTMAGRPVVHGVNILLSAAERAMDAGLLKGGRLKSVKASFKRPLLLDETADIDIDGDAGQARIRVSIGRTALSIFTLEFDGGEPVAGAVAAVDPEPAAPKAIEFDTLREGSEAQHPIACAGQTIFPHLDKSWGRSAIAVLVSLSRLIGMDTPGLDSMLSDITLRIDGSPIEGMIGYSLTRKDERFRRLEIAISGRGLSGRVIAFSPKSRVTQPTAAEVASVVPEDYTGRHALVVGGSRGLGEVVAKAVAAGGGRVTLTYARGSEEAERVAGEINAYAGRPLAQTARLDVNDPMEASPLADLAAFSDVTSIYYMATPQIFGERRRAFDAETYARFTRFYVEFPFELMSHFGSDGVRRAFMWPSSVAVELASPGAAEYVIAKAAGEKLVEVGSKIWPSLRFVVERLPRIETDQTIVLSPTEAAAVLDIIPDLVRRTEAAATA